MTTNTDRDALTEGARSLRNLCQPGSVVVVGASADPAKLAGRTIPNLLRYGYSGRIFAVNPGRDEVNGIACHRSVPDLPEVPDSAFVVTPAASVVDALRQLDALGVRTATVVASSFGEDGSPEGIARGRELARFLAESPMRVLGPNSIGTLSTQGGAVFRATTNLPERLVAGRVSVAAQSGAISLILLHLLHTEGLGVASVIPLGNEVDLGLPEAIVHLSGDGATRCVIAFIESIARPQALATAVATAREAGVEVVAIVAGRSATGRAIASGHTGALATDHRLVTAFLRDLGVAVVAHPREAVEVARLAAGQPRRQDRDGLVFVCFSGGEAALLADLADAHDVDLPQPDPHQSARLSKEFRFTTPRNPFDVTADALTHPELFRTAYQVLGADPRVGRVAFVLPPLTAFDYRRVAAVLDTLGGEGPAVSVVDWPVAGEDHGHPGRFHDSAAFVAAYARLSHAARFDRSAALAGAERACGTTAGTRWLADAEVRERARAAGLHLVPERFVTDEAEVAAACAELPGPWVLKASVAGVPHKTDWGGVCVGLKSCPEVVDALARLRAAADHRWPGRWRGAWVQQTVRGVEAYVGAVRHPSLGPFLVVGRGGVDVEHDADVRFLTLPVDRAGLRRSLTLLGVEERVLVRRGQGTASADALTDAGLAIARLLDDPVVTSVDANPLFLQPGEAHAVAVDVRIAGEEGSTDANR